MFPQVIPHPTPGDGVTVTGTAAGGDLDDVDDGVVVATTTVGDSLDGGGGVVTDGSDTTADNNGCAICIGHACINVCV